MSKCADEGFSLVEVIIAMFLLAVLSLAVLPLIIGATRLSVTNKDLVAATTFANSQLAPIRDAFPVNPGSPTKCSDLQARAVASVIDPAGTGLVATVVVGACPTAYPGSVAVTVTVKEGSSTLVKLPTRILVATS